MKHIMKSVMFVLGITAFYGFFPGYSAAGALEKEAVEAVTPEPLPQGNEGIAARYPGDAGIGQDPAVVFVEMFDGDTLDALIGDERWPVRYDGNNIMSLSDETPDGGSRNSLLMTHVGGKGTGGRLRHYLDPGHKKLHARFYIKFDPDCARISHLGTRMGGKNPPTRWPGGGAGQRPPGDRRFSVAAETFGNSWRWDFYNYWMEMRGSPPRGQTWGNSFLRNHDPELRDVRLGEWISVEIMVKLNDIGQRNGELALWIDGRLVGHLGKGFPKGKWMFDSWRTGEGGTGIRWCEAEGDRARFEVAEGGEPFEGFVWRDDEALEINYIEIHLYLTAAEEGHVSKIWWDHIVVAEEYIGPIMPGDDGKE